MECATNRKLITGWVSLYQENSQLLFLLAISGRFFSELIWIIRLNAYTITSVQLNSKGQIFKRGMLLIGRAAWEIWFNQSEAPSRFGYWCVISMEFQCLFLRRHLAGKPVVASPNVGFFLRLRVRPRVNFSTSVKIAVLSKFTSTPKSY